MEEHLAKNGVDIKQTKLTLGPTLKIDSKAERFVDSASAACCDSQCCKSGAVTMHSPPVRGAELLLAKSLAQPSARSKKPEDCCGEDALTAKANALISRPYRAPFIVPAKV